MGFYATTSAPSRTDSQPRRSKSAYPRFSGVMSGHRFYSPVLGKWLSRDPIEENGSSQARENQEGITSHNLYSAFANNSVGNIDYLGLLKWEKKAVQGCNAGYPFESWGYGHVPAETDLPPPPWSPGASGSFAHGCWVSSWFFNPALCNTYTYVTIQVTNDECCEKWQVECDWAYAGEQKGTLFAMWKMKIRFLGQELVGIIPPARDPAIGDSTPGTYSISELTLGFKRQLVTIPQGSTIETLWFEPVSHVHGKPNKIVEVGQASCSAKCVE